MVAVAAQACSATGERSSALPSPDASVWPTHDATAWDAACAEAGLTGEGLGIAGPDDANAFLFVGSICPFGLQQVQGVRRVSTATMGAGRVAIAHGADGYDRLAEVVDGRLRPVQDVPADRKVFTPALNHDGDLAYVDTDDPAGDTLRVLLAGAEESTVAYRGPGHLAWPVWSHQGGLLVAEEIDASEGPGSSVVVLDPGAQPRALPVPFPIVGLSVSAAGPVAVSPPVGLDQVSAVVMDPTTGQSISRIPAGWLVYDFTPDGDTLLVGRGEQVAFLSGPQFSELRELPASPLGSTFEFSYER